MSATRLKSIPKPPENKRVGIYCRVSTSHDDQMNSLANQVGKLMQDVMHKGNFTLYDVYVDVGSGYGNYERRNFERLIKDCHDGKVNYILTKSVSRFYRDTVFLLKNIRELKEIGVEVYFQNENISSFDGEAELLLAITGAIAQSESDNKSEIIKWGIMRAKENPNSKMNNRVFYGYEHDENGKPIINSEQAKVVRKIYQLYNAGLSVIKIISELEKEEVLTARGNKKWSKRAIDVILTDERYTGERRTGPAHRVNIEKLPYPPIISASEFDEAQANRKERSNLVTTEDGKKRKPVRYKSV